MKLLGTMRTEENTLYIGGVSTKELVKEYSTPLYVIDEQQVRSVCREYLKNFKVKENGNRVTYAGKAFLPMEMCKIINEEGLCLDVVSGGELYTAYKSGFPMKNVLFHGNNKTIEEIKMGISLGVGRFVTDNLYEIEKINEFAKKENKTVNIYIRITPGIEAHTHDYIKTGQIDSKFGFTLINDGVMNAVKDILKLENVKLMGLHAHIGSQIFDVEPFVDEVEVMFNIMNDIRSELGIELPELDLGGGFGIYYTEEDKPKNPKFFCDAILKKAEEMSRKLEYPMPKLVIEPGRSVIGNAGTTLYTVGSIKEIPGVRKYISVDGGMTDNIRPSLYRADYECAIANKMNCKEEEIVTVAGKCCESGDILISDAKLPTVDSGDILAVATTGAYGYSMASNYNKIPRPAVVMVKDGVSRVACKRQSYEDLLALEII
ncbi:diaminopimelate decarboxylase [Clostridium bornimense]|uniref:diaminopimelate decarboxylase n=1 Tax=Clostridium bornimense TaxID=1216932 RepID=UPI001C123E30|nr:diaminopimelate decarboxylase [Clostridium bornimense]MBU5316043.1 diaminopimelate decarboxylase [Clostridium bornimense]